MLGAAKDAGAFFLRFYIFSIVLSIVSVHTIMSSGTMAKFCQAQQESLPFAPDSSKARQTYFPTNECQMYASKNPPHFNSTISTPIYCACSQACGPYVTSSNMYEPIVSEMKKYQFTSTSLHLLTENAIILWALIVGIIVKNFFLKNSLDVSNEANMDRATEFANASETLRRRIRKLEKKVALHEQMNSTTA